MCGNRPIVAVHWRSKLDEICTDKSAVISSKSACQKKEEFLLKSASTLPKAYDLQCIYVSQPPSIKRGIVKYLSPRIPKVYSSVDVIAMANKLSPKPSVFSDDYFLSLVEQEICEGAAIFISGKNSAWASFVRHNREKSPNAKPSVYLSDLPDMPNYIDLI
ncbi:uncharacterized protein [Ptychodera flava]|uniref:uncharacterized protein n=1 Tax=Ptychodera flava TaxID=63121 RepID=UPI003969C450